MKKNIKSILFLILIFGLSSCFKMDYTLKINKDLSTNASVVYDFTEVNSLARKQIKNALLKAKINTGVTVTETSTGYIIKKVIVKKTLHSTSTGTSINEISKIQNPCNKLLDEYNSKKLLNTYLGYKSAICENLDKTNDKVLLKLNGGNLKNILKIENGNYVIDLKKIDGEKNTKDTKKVSKEKNMETAKSLQMMGIKANYKIYFPSKIIKSDVGTFSGNVLSYSINDLLSSSSDNPIVEFQKINDSLSGNSYTQETNLNYLPNKGVLYHNLIISRNKLLKSIRLRKYIYQIDILVGKLNYNKNQLNKLYKKLNGIDLNKGKYKRYKNIFIYLKAKVGLKIYNLYEK